MPFPVELLSLTLEYLGGDLKTLKSCSLACHDLNYISKPLLFHTVKLKSTSDIQSLADLVQREPRIGDLIQELITVDSSITSEQLVSLSTLLPTLLPNLRFLKLSEVSRPPQIAPSFLRDALMSFKTIKDFSFHGYSYALPFEVASSLTSLDCLSIRYYGTQARDPPPEMPPLTPDLHLTVFSFHAPPSAPVDLAFSWILSTSSRYSLRAVKLFVPQPHAEVYGSFLRELGPALNHLDLTFPPSVNMTGENSCTCTVLAQTPSLIILSRLSAASPHIHLGENTGLRSLVVRNVPSPFLRVLLSTISITSVESITIFVPSLCGEDYWDYVESQSLRQIDGQHFWSLKELVFVFRGYPEDKLTTQQKVEEIFQRYHQTNVLKFIDTPEFEERCLGLGFGRSLL